MEEIRILLVIFSFIVIFITFPIITTWIAKKVARKAVKNDVFLQIIQYATFYVSSCALFWFILHFWARVTCKTEIEERVAYMESSLIQRFFVWATALLIVEIFFFIALCIKKHITLRKNPL